MNKVFDPRSANAWNKFWSIYYMVKNGKIDLPKESDHIRLKRWRILCVLMNRYYISIYKAIKFVNKGIMIVKSLDLVLNLDEFKNNTKILDMVWFCIMRKYRESKMMLIMEKLFMDRLTKVKKRRKKAQAKLDLNFIAKKIRQWAIK